jgi:hypothetical protein
MPGHGKRVATATVPISASTKPSGRKPLRNRFNTPSDPCAEKPVFRQRRFTQRITVSKQEEQVRHIFGINKASPSNGQQGESQSQECKRQHDSAVATGFSGKICGSVHHFLRFSARENETDGRPLVFRLDDPPGRTRARFSACESALRKRSFESAYLGTAPPTPIAQGPSRWLAKTSARSDAAPRSRIG